MLHYNPNPSQVRSLNKKEFLKTNNNLENVRELNKNAQIRKRFHSYTQLTMSYFSQLGKNKILL